jgi:hypothetical protein
MSVPKEYQTVKKNHSLEVLSVVLLVAGVALFVYFNAKIGEEEVLAPEIPMVPLPAPDAPSIFSPETQAQINSIQMRIQRGEITLEEGGAQIDALLNPE